MGEPECRVIVHECGPDYRKVLETMAHLNGLFREYKVEAGVQERREPVGDYGHYIPHGKVNTWVIEEYIYD